MNKSNVTVASTTDTSKLVRAKFGAGMLLQHEDLEQLNVYTRELSRLLFRSFFGCGVICGLVVKADVDNCNKVIVTIGAGLALDCSGDPVHVSTDKRIVLDETCYPDLPTPLWVVLCRTAKNCAPRTSMCTDDDDKTTSVCTRERDMFEIRVVRERPTCACGCGEPSDASSSAPSDPTYSALKDSPEQQGGKDPCLCADPNLNCYTDHYAGRCGCNCGDSSDCGCNCILLARVYKDEKAAESKWMVDHRVRRFIRPVLMRDPQVEREVQDRQYAKLKAQYARNIEIAETDVRDANTKATTAEATANEAANKATVAAKALEAKLTAAQLPEDQLTTAKDVARNARAAAKNAKTAANKAAPGDKAAAEKAAADAEKAKDDADAELKKAIARKEDAETQLQAVTDDEKASKVIADRAENDRLAAYRAVTDAKDRLAVLKRELASLEARYALRDR